MKRLIFSGICLILAVVTLSAQKPVVPTKGSEDTKGIMSPAYWEIWNDEEQARIDADIDAYRKADATFKTGRIKNGTAVKVEQIKSEFVFGCSAFNWNQLGSYERNEAYRNLFGTLFNRATVPFYWKDFEQDPGNMRFVERYNDTEKFWNKAGNTKMQPNWRRPCTDPMVQWLNEHDVAVHGHPLVWGNMKWQIPRWVRYDGVPENERRGLDTLQLVYFTSNAKCPKKVTVQEVADNFPVYLKNLEQSTYRRIDAIMGRYAGKIQSWDVVNESATDYGLGVQDPSLPACLSHYGFFFPDYTFRSMKRAEANNAAGALLNINDYVVDERFINQAENLIKRGAKVDVFGSQMHLFQPQQCLDIAAGKPFSGEERKLVVPSRIRPFFEKLGSFGVPTCLSEITITSAGEGERGEMIQAIIARNLYRIWFSLPSMMGITWWNAVDDCGAPGEPTISGVCHRDMTPKIVYYALDQLINHEWRTNLSLKPNGRGIVSFRGFKGTYRITWTDTKGVEHTETYILK